ncbi:MAG: YtxH domain-containing protein [Anaerolineae bacterium]|nr:YtxH domain-containing protein [Anaerolineae bacterium]
MRKLMDFLSGLVAGALVGGAIGLLLSPQPGSETQQGLRARVTEIIEEGKRAAAQRRAELEAELAEAKKYRAGS